MKDFLFGILIILLTPVYFIIWLFRVICKITSESFLGEILATVVTGMKNIVENMINFWKGILNKWKK